MQTGHQDRIGKVAHQLSPSWSNAYSTETKRNETKNYEKINLNYRRVSPGEAHVLELVNMAGERVIIRETWEDIDRRYRKTLEETGRK